MTAHDSARLLTPERHASHADQGASRFDDPLRFYSVREAAFLCKRTEGTIRNLVSAYQLPRKSSWIVRGRHRQRAVMLRAPVVEWLQRITLLGDSAARERPPR